MKRIYEICDVDRDEFPNDELQQRDVALMRLMNSSQPTADMNALLGKPGLRHADAVTWRKWSRMRKACLWQAVALHCSLDPRYMTSTSIRFDDDLPNDSAARFYQEREIIAAQHLNDGTLKSGGSQDCSLLHRTVMLTDYRKWAQEMDMPLPPEFPSERALKIITGEPINKWPWGSHDTALLRLLAEVGNLWRPESEGGNYDPEDPTTAPTNNQIESWLKARGVSNKTSQVMATMLRDDDLPSGPRCFKTK